MGGPASAKDVPDDVQTATDGQEIVVTAQRRAEKAQDVPAALTVLTGADLEKRNLQNVTDLENAVPSLEIDSQFGGGQPQFRLRGVGGTDYAANNTNTVGVYVDEVAFPYGVTTQNAFFDIARIEVLRGPQGTLYGRNSTGGAINVISNAPSDRFGAGIDLSYGSFNAVSAQGYVTGPITDTLSARIALSADRGGAWQRNRDTGEALGDRDQTSGRLRLRWTPDAATTVDLIGHYTRDRSDGLGLQLLTDFTTARGITYKADTDIRTTGWGVSPTFAQIMGVGTDAKPFRNNIGKGGSIHVTSDLGTMQLTGIYAHEDFTRREFNDWDATASNEAGTYFFNRIKTDSGELRIASPDHGDFRWLGGLYVSRERVTGGFYSDFSDFPSLRNFWKTSYDQHVESVSAFGNVEQYLTPRLRLSAGARYEYERRALSDFRSEIIAPVYNLRATANPVLHMREWSGKALLDWQFIDTAHAYASVSRGVKSGGFTTYNSGLPAQLDPYEPEVLKAYEVGLKSELFGRRLRLNLAAFYYDYLDQQLQGVLYTTTTRVGRILNVPRSHLYGAEAEISFNPVPLLSIDQAIAYKYGQYDEFVSQSNATLNPTTGTYSNIQYVDNAGQRLPLPDLDYKGRVALHVPAGGWRIEPEVNWAYRAERFSVSDASRIPGYWLANANLGISPPGTSLTIAAYVYNLFDERIEETRNRFISARTVGIHPPRTFGMRLSYNY
ncbi:TonB-dependent receptor [Sphingomonas sp. S6]|jgi:iron complex outermembrane receptor protein|uniref:TonB-dependent receptor n=1 Tax=Sphingomonas sp. S6 TaxID=3368600 RepID=UPI000FA091C3|nr:MAG: TonB-dependent receptor [Sphingomonadaceae bacterium]